MEIEGRTAIVTGGAVRVGAGISMELAREGAAVFIHYNRSAESAIELRDRIVAEGGVAAIGSADLSDPGTATDILEAATAALSNPTILINSASAFHTDTISDFTLEGFHEAQDLSLVTPLVLTQAFAAQVREDSGGSIVNLTDVRTTRPYRKHISYLLAKGGLDTLTRVSALSLAPKIRVNAIALGVILPPSDKEDDYAVKLAEELPLGHVGGAQVVADTVVFLCKNDFITGEIIRVDGGGHLI